MPFSNTKTYQIDFTTLPAGLLGATAVNSITTALQKWSDVVPIDFVQVQSGADYRFRFDGLVDNGDGTTTDISTINPAGAAQPLAFTRNAQTTFNPLGSWTFPDPINPNDDMQNVALHEIGHFLGLGHSTLRTAVMYPNQQGVSDLSEDDIEQAQAILGARAVLVPGWFGDSTSGADVAIADFSPASPLIGGVGPAPTPELCAIVGQVDNPDGPDQPYLRFGYKLNAKEAKGGWSPAVPAGATIGNDTQGMALATGVIKPKNNPPEPVDLVMAYMDNPGGENQLFYRVALDLATTEPAITWVGEWPVPGPWGSETAEIACTLADINGSGGSDLIVAWIDDPDGENAIYYKIGWDIAANGSIATWSDRFQVSGPIGDSSSGLGIAVSDFRGNARPDLIVFWVDNPDGNNRGYYRVGEDLDPTGVPIGGWGADRYAIPGPWGFDTQGAGIALAALRGLQRLDLAVFNVDAAPAGYLRLLSPSLPTWHNPKGPPAERPLFTLRRLRSPPMLSSWRRSAHLRQPARPRRSRSACGIAPTSTRIREAIFWNLSGRHTTVNARAGSAIAAASRKPSIADVFYIDQAGHVLTSANAAIAQAGTTVAQAQSNWNVPGQQVSPAGARRIRHWLRLPRPRLTSVLLSRGSRTIWRSRPGPMRPVPGGAAVSTGPGRGPSRRLAAVGAAPSVLLLIVDGNDAIWQAMVDTQSNFSGATKILPDGSVASNVVAVSRAPGQFDLFWIDRNGVPRSTFQGPGAPGWAAPFTVATPIRPLTTSKSRRSRMGDNRLQVFWEEADRAIRAAWWAPRPDGIAPPWSASAEVVPAGSTAGSRDMAAVSRATGLARLFFVASTGNMADVFWGRTP